MLLKGINTGVYYEVGTLLNAIVAEFFPVGFTLLHLLLIFSGRFKFILLWLPWCLLFFFYQKVQTDFKDLYFPVNLFRMFFPWITDLSRLRIGRISGSLGGTQKCRILFFPFLLGEAAHVLVPVSQHMSN